jgi:Cu/Ag efflux protein CusF
VKVAAWILGVALAASAWAQQDHSAHHAAALADGEVRRIDKDAKKITIKHGPIANLEMPAHTMVFQVKDPEMLERVKVGDKVRFEAQKVGGAFLLLQIDKAQ